jgi:hypothetical protein
MVSGPQMRSCSEPSFQRDKLDLEGCSPTLILGGGMGYTSCDIRFSKAHNIYGVGGKQIILLLLYTHSCARFEFRPMAMIH